MVYRILYYLVNVLLRIYFRRIYIKGIENVPKNQAVMIVCNHPMGFVEPILMACLFPIDLNFLVRGDLFENKWLRRFLLSTHQIPIYRFKDGFSSLRNNQETINYVVEVMRKRQALVIFAEGSTEMIMQLRPLKKGMPRMALQALESDPTLDIKVLPVGMTFTRGFAPLSEVAISVGPAFSINALIQANPESEPIALINEKTHAAMKHHMVDLNHKEDEDTIRKYWDLYNVRNNPTFLPRVRQGISIIDELKNLENQLNTEYTREQIKTQLYADRKKMEAKMPFGMVSGLRNNIGYILCFIPGILGLVYYFIPIYGALRLQKKLVKQKEFISAIIIASGGGFTLIWLMLSLLISIFIFGGIGALFFLIFAFVSGLTALYLLDYRYRV